MADIQQQIADGARPLARVGDVIEHGQDIPGNVVRFTDSVGDLWRRISTVPLTFSWGGRPLGIHAMRDSARWWPFTVVEVDPEPQPAEVSDVQRVRGVLSRLGDEPSAVAAFERIQGMLTAGAIDRAIVDRVADLLDVSSNEDIIGRLQYRLGEGSQQPAAPQPVNLVPGDATLRALGQDRAVTALEDLSAAIERLWPGAGWTPDEPTRTSGPQVFEVPQPPPGDLLDLIKRWGNQMYRLGVVDRGGNTEQGRSEAREISEEGGALMRQVKEALQPAAPLPAAPCSRCAGLAVELAGTQQMLDVMTAHEPGPHVLTLPVVPAEAVALSGTNGAGDSVRCLPHPSIPALWVLESDINKAVADCMSLADVLNQFGPVTVEFAPPREPRTWPRLDAAPEIDDLPAVVDVIGDGRWYRLTERGAEHLYAQRGHEGGWRLSLDGLRHLGEVREVLDDGQ